MKKNIILLFLLLSFQAFTEDDFPKFRMSGLSLNQNTEIEINDREVMLYKNNKIIFREIYVFENIKGITFMLIGKDKKTKWLVLFQYNYLLIYDSSEKLIYEFGEPDPQSDLSFVTPKSLKASSFLKENINF